MRKLLLSLSLFCTLSLAACADDPVTPPPVVEPSIRAGSTFTFEHKVYRDTLWTDLESTDSQTYTVASVDTAFAAQLHAHFVASTNDTTIYRALADSNLALYQPAIEIPSTGVTYPESWPLLPIKTKESSIITIEDDSAVTIMTEFGQFPGIVHTTLISGYVGIGSVVVDGKTYPTEEAFVERNVKVAVQGQVVFTRVRQIYSYSPELKTFVARKQKAFSNHDFSPVPNGGETWTLVNFKL